MICVLRLYEVGERVRPPSIPAPLDGYVLWSNVTEGVQRLRESIIVGRWGASENPDSRFSPRRLRVGRNAGKRQAQDRGRDERPPVHYRAFLIHAPIRPSSTPPTTTVSANPTRASPNRSRSVMERSPLQGSGLFDQPRQLGPHFLP